MVDYRTNWTIQKKNNIDQRIYQLLASAGKKTLNYPHKYLFFQYVCLLYLAGKRRIEPFLYPVTIIKKEEKGILFYKVTSAVAKHYESNIKRCRLCGKIFKTNKSMKEHKKLSNHKQFFNIGKRRISSHIWCCENAEEKALWEYLCEGKGRITIDFNVLLPPRFHKMPEEARLKEYETTNGNFLNGITLKFKQFTTNITNGREVKETNIVPHMLRHLRAYDLIVNHHYNDILVQRLLDWDNHNMVYYYLDIKDMLQEEDEILQYIERERNK